MLLLDQKMLSSPQFFLNVDFDELNVISAKNVSDTWVRPGVFKNLYKQDHPYAYHSP